MNNKQPPPLPTLRPGDSHMESLIEAAIQVNADTREAMRWLVRQLVPVMQQAEVTDEQIESCALEAGFSVESTGSIWAVDGYVGTRVDPGLRKFAKAILAMRPQQSGLTGCNCRWDGDTQVQWCELHLAHKEAIHEWAERAKSAEQKLAMRPVQVPMDKQDAWDNSPVNSDWEAVDAYLQGIEDAEAHHGITAQAKKEGA